MADLLDYRSRFDSLEGRHYLIANSLGAMPSSAREYAQRYVDVWADRGVRAWSEEWWMLPRVVGDKIATIIGAPADSVSMHPNVTSAEETVISCFEGSKVAGGRDKVVMVDMEFPSIQHLYHAHSGDKFEIEIVLCPDGISVPLEELLAAIDERTLLVPISQVLFRSSYIVDAKAIIEKAHSVGAFVVLDIFQSIGVAPVNLTELNVDFAVGGLLKWMCGGPGACFLYVRPDLAGTLSPKFTGWMAHENPFGFERGPIKHTTGCYKFQCGTPVIPALYTCQGGLDLISEIGVDRIRGRSKEMSALMMKLASERGWKTTTHGNSEKRAGTVALDLADGQELCAILNERNYLVDYRPNCGIRVSPHFYNTDGEIADLFGEIDSIIKAGAHKPSKQDSSNQKPASSTHAG
jgi:kynureninase